MEIKNQTLLGSLITLLAYIYDLISTPLFWILIFFILIDYLMWLYSSYKIFSLNLKLCLNKIAEKTFIGVLVLMSTMVDYLLLYYGIDSKGIFHNFIMGLLIAREFASIAKNADIAGFWIPSFFKNAIDKINKLNKEEK